LPALWFGYSASRPPPREVPGAAIEESEPLAEGARGDAISSGAMDEGRLRLDGGFAWMGQHAGEPGEENVEAPFEFSVTVVAREY
jgi:hypothetical protein